jgi:hypothetical protein
MKYSFFTVVCIMSILCLGCGEKLTYVTGKVTVDGKEIEGATVTFTSAENASIFSQSITDAGGMYSLQTLRGGAKTIRGAAPGSYIVAIVKKEDDGPPKQDTSAMTIEEKTKYEMSLSGGSMRNKKFIYHVPKKYEVASNSGLTAEVPASGSIVCNFELDSK